MSSHSNVQASEQSAPAPHHNGSLRAIACVALWGKGGKHEPFVYSFTADTPFWARCFAVAPISTCCSHTHTRHSHTRTYLSSSLFSPPTLELGNSHHCAYTCVEGGASRKLVHVAPVPSWLSSTDADLHPRISALWSLLSPVCVCVCARGAHVCHVEPARCVAGVISALDVCASVPGWLLSNDADPLSYPRTSARGSLLSSPVWRGYYFRRVRALPWGRLRTSVCAWVWVCRVCCFSLRTEPVMGLSSNKCVCLQVCGCAACRACMSR
jgi:hypothetical protein